MLQAASSKDSAKDAASEIIEKLLYKLRAIQNAWDEFTRSKEYKEMPEGYLDGEDKKTGASAVSKGFTGDGIIDMPSTKGALEMLEIDELGLDPADRNMLTLMIDKYGNRPVGLNTIAALTGDETSTIEDYFEPYLIQIGMIQRTPKGRIVTENAKKHLGKA
jgi:hypothetical protein